MAEYELTDEERAALLKVIPLIDDPMVREQIERLSTKPAASIRLGGAPEPGSPKPSGAVGTIALAGVATATVSVPDVTIELSHQDTSALTHLLEVAPDVVRTADGLVDSVEPLSRLAQWLSEHAVNLGEHLLQVIAHFPSWPA